MVCCMNCVGHSLPRTITQLSRPDQQHTSLHCNAHSWGAAVVHRSSLCGRLTAVLRGVVLQRVSTRSFHGGVFAALAALATVASVAHEQASLLLPPVYVAQFRVLSGGLACVRAWWEVHLSLYVWFGTKPYVSVRSHVAPSAWACVLNWHSCVVGFVWHARGHAAATLHHVPRLLAGSWCSTTGGSLPVWLRQGCQEFCMACMLAGVCTGELGSACWQRGCEGILQQILLEQLLFQWLVARGGKLCVHADTNQACREHPNVPPCHLEGSSVMCTGTILLCCFSNMLVQGQWAHSACCS